MLYSRLSGSSEELLLREIPRLCSEKYKAGFLIDLTGLTAFIVDTDVVINFRACDSPTDLCWKLVVNVFI